MTRYVISDAGRTAKSAFYALVQSDQLPVTAKIAAFRKGIRMQKDWISMRQADRMLGVGRDVTARLVRKGRLTVMRLPGCYPRVRRDEIVRLAEASTCGPQSPAIGS